MSRSLSVAAGIDPSLRNTAIVFLDEHGRVTAHRLFQTFPSKNDAPKGSIKPRGRDTAERIFLIADNVYHILSEEIRRTAVSGGFLFAAIEGPAWAGRKVGVLGMVQGAIRQELMRLESERRDHFAWSELAPVTVKRFALGAPLRKETPRDKSAIRDAICELHGNHVPWGKTDYDLWDALVLAEACRLSMKNHSEIEPLGRIRMTILERLGDGLL